MVTKKPSRPFYDVFLERVIRIGAVQRHRPEATDEYASGFFDAGRLLGELDDFRWSLDAPELLSRRGGQFLGVINARSFTPSKEEEISPAMQAAWDAAVAAWRVLVGEIKSGAYIATATHPVTGVRRKLDPVELREDFVLDVRSGDLLRKERGGKLTEQWLGIVLQAATKRSLPTAKRGPSLVDWHLLMTYGVLHREAGSLPSKHGSLTAKLNDLAKLLFRVEPDDADLRRLTADIYGGRRKRRKRKR